MSAPNPNPYILTLLLDSRNRLIGGTPTNCTIQLNTPIYNVRKARVSRFTFYNTIYTVNANNNLLILTSGATTYTISIAIGFYNALTFGTQLQSDINLSVGGGIVVSFNDRLEKYTISGFAAPFNYVHTSSTCSKLIGMTQNRGSFTTITSDTIISMVPVDYFFINSSALGVFVKSVTFAGYNTVILKKIPITAASNFLIDFIDPYEPSTTPYDGSKDLTYLDFQLVDVTNREIPLQADWSMEITIERQLSSGGTVNASVTSVLAATSSGGGSSNDSNTVSTAKLVSFLELAFQQLQQNSSIRTTNLSDSTGTTAIVPSDGSTTSTGTSLITGLGSQIRTGFV